MKRIAMIIAPVTLEALDLTTVLSASGDEPPAEFTETLTPCFGG